MNWYVHILKHIFFFRLGSRRRAFIWIIKYHNTYNVGTAGSLWYVAHMIILVCVCVDKIVSSVILKFHIFLQFVIRWTNMVLVFYDTSANVWVEKKESSNGGQSCMIYYWGPEKKKKYMHQIDKNLSVLTYDCFTFRYILYSRGRFLWSLFTQSQNQYNLQLNRPTVEWGTFMPFPNMNIWN